METITTIKNGHIDTNQQGVRGKIAFVNQLFGLTAYLALNGPEQVPDRLNATVPPEGNAGGCNAVRALKIAAFKPVKPLRQDHVSCP